MKTYIGTKIIEAVPAIRKGCKVYEKDQPIAMGMVPDEEGYKVCYPDGYESFSPKAVFEEAYRPIDSMNFGLAIEAMKKEKKAYVLNWLAEHGITLDEERIDALIEAAVYELNHGVLKEGAGNE